MKKQTKKTAEKKETPVIIKGYKGYNKDLKCRNFQYEIGKEYETDKAQCCNTGFHFCENPMDIFNYYSPSDSRFTEVEGSGDIDKENSDSKVAVTKIKIGAELNIKDLIKATFSFVKSKTTNSKIGEDWSALTGGDRSALTGGNSSALTGGDRSALTGGYSSALTGGYRSALTGGDSSALTGGYRSALTGGDRSALTGGDRSALTGGDRSALTGGDRSALTGGYSSALTGGDNSVIYGCGIDAKVRGGINSLLALAQFDDNYNIKKVISKVVDGKKIKENIFYTLKNGKFTEVE